MKLNHSVILQNTFRKIFPFIIMFSFYMLSYGANYPGGGFQAGVISGTVIITYKLVFKSRKKEDSFYKSFEFIAVFTMFLLIVMGVITGPYFFFWPENMISESIIFSNIFIFILNTLIFFEVTGSIVLIFKYFLDGGKSEITK